MRINVTRSSMPEFDEYMEEIRDLWDSRWLTNMGSKHQALQESLERFLDVPHVILYTNGHLALENAVAAMDLPAGGEVITTPFTFVSTTHAISRNGLVPVFCDINDRDYTIDADKIESLITEKTAAILPVHVYGNVCEVEKIADIAARYHLKVVYDAAHAFAVRKNGVSTASFGDMSMFSFHATKVFHTIEGGAVCFKDDGMVQEMNDRKNFGIRNSEECAYIGGNAKMNEFQAAMGLCNLRHLEKEIEKRKAVFTHYHARLDGVPGITMPAVQKDIRPNYAYFPVVFDGFRKTRDEIAARLAEEDIYARKYFYPLTNDYACYRDFPTAGKEKTPVAAHIADCVLTLPMYADLSADDIDRICDLVLE